MGTTSDIYWLIAMVANPRWELFQALIVEGGWITLSIRVWLNVARQLFKFIVRSLAGGWSRMDGVR